MLTSHAETLILIAAAVMMGLGALTYFVINIFYKAKCRKKNSGIADDDTILESYDRMLHNVVFWKLEMDWNAAGREARKPKGGYYPDFQSAAEKELQSVKDSGIIKPDDVLQAIHAHGGNPEAFRVSSVMEDEIIAIFKAAGYMK